jgi:hypothetical protein
VKIPASLIRFMLEAGFLVLVATAVAIAHLSAAAIVLVMAMAWVLVALVERTASHSNSAIRSGRLGFLFGAPPGDGASGEIGAAVANEQIEEPEEPVAPRRSLRKRFQARRSEPEVAPDVELEPPPSHVHVLSSGVSPASESAAVVEGEPPVVEPVPPVVEPVPAPQPPAPELRAVPPPPPPAEPPPVREPDRVVAFAPRANGPHHWNLWDLERVAREGEGADAARDEERVVLLMELRQFASADGMLPESFDGLVRESFSELIGYAGR